MTTTKTILITGASTGFGRDTAQTLARAGHTVFASMRDPKAKNRLHADALRGQDIDAAGLRNNCGDSSIDRLRIGDIELDDFDVLASECVRM